MKPMQLYRTMGESGGQPGLGGKNEGDSLSLEEATKEYYSREP